MSGAGDAVRTVLRGIGQTFITLGLVIMLFCVYELYFTNVYTAKEQSGLREDIRAAWAAPAAPPAPGRKLVASRLGSGLAVIWIPRIGMTGKSAKVVLEGVGTEDLKRGPGHYPGTALPGQVGNAVISGHRTTYGAPFNRLDEVAVGEAVVLETRDTWFTYRVVRQQVVAPTAVEVTYPVPGDLKAKPTKKLLTLTTCNPKFSARTRLIITAELEAESSKSAGLPQALAGSA